MFSKHKKILLILIGIVVVFFLYWYFVLSKKNTTTATNVSTGGLVQVDQNTSTGTTSESLKIDKQFINGILSLNSVKIDTDIFKYPAYEALNYPDKPFTVDFDLQAGRVNPFLPIGVNSREDLGLGIKVQQTTEAPAVVSSSSTPAIATSSAATSTGPVVPKPKPVKK